MCCGGYGQANGRESMEHERLIWDYLSLVFLDCQRNKTSMKHLRRIIMIGLGLYPNNPDFMTLFIVCEAKYVPFSIRVPSFYRSICPFKVHSMPANVTRIFSVVHFRVQLHWLLLFVWICFCFYLFCIIWPKGVVLLVVSGSTSQLLFVTKTRYVYVVYVVSSCILKLSVLHNLRIYFRIITLASFFARDSSPRETIYFPMCVDLPSCSIAGFTLSHTLSFLLCACVLYVASASIYTDTYCAHLRSDFTVGSAERLLRVSSTELT